MSKKNKKTTRFVIEVVEEKQKALIIYRQRKKIANYIYKKLQENHIVFEYGLEGNQELVLTKNQRDYDLVVFIDVFPKNPELLKGNKLNIFVYFFNLPEYKKRKKWCENNLKNYKIVNIGVVKKPVTEILDFVFFKTPTPYSFNFSQVFTSSRPIFREIEPKKVFYLILKILLGIVFVLNFLFFILFFYQWLLFWDLWRHRNDGFTTLSAKIKKIDSLQKLNNGLFFIPKNTLFWLPGIGGVYNFVDTTRETTEFINSGSRLFENYTLLLRLFLLKNKTDAQKKEILLRIKYTRTELEKFDGIFYRVFSSWQKTNLFFLNSKKTKFLELAEQIRPYLNSLKTLTKNINNVFGVNKSTRYLVLFMNNMELRPGGGFIGSVGVVEFYDFSMKDIRVYDVYTLDGQLKTHLDPPEPIKEYLNQPHWFLRDSAYSPDFNKNAAYALNFVKEEVGWEDFDGVFGVTLTTVQNIIGIFPDFYVAEYKEHITADNFFIKAQQAAEDGFFPGSHNKKNFLGAVMRTLIVKLEEGGFDFLHLFKTVFTSLENKFIVLYFKNNDLQLAFDELFWTGRVIEPGCNVGEDCFFDYLLLTDANLGVNKANFFIQRSIRLVTKIERTGAVTNTLMVDYKNESLPDIFPGGVYKNYVQLYIPKEVLLKKVLIDGRDVRDYKEGTDAGFKTVGLLLIVPAQTQTNLRVEYVFTNKLSKDKSYQLIVQKQVGSINNDLIYEMHIPDNFSLLNTNFNPVVNSEGFVYNTFLEKDRLLLIKFK